MFIIRIQARVLERDLWGVGRTTIVAEITVYLQVLYINIDNIVSSGVR